MTNLPKPLKMSDTEILDWVQLNCGVAFDTGWLGRDLRQAVCQAAAILQEKDK